MKKLRQVMELMGKGRGKVVASAPVEETVMRGVYDGDKDARLGRHIGGVGGGGETITDDAPLAPDTRAALGRDEALVREVLRLVGVDYDALIVMDGQSPYSQAVAANPALVQDILKDEMPVLAAVRVAMGYKPVAEFTGKYGSDPASIKAKIREEVLAEMKGEVEPVTKPVVGPLFSQRFGRGEVAPVRKKGLEGVFGK